MENDKIFEEIERDLFNDCFMEDVSLLPDDVRQAYLESDEAILLEKKRLINGKTRILMSKEDDIKRRSRLAALQLSRANKDPLYKKYTLHRAIMKATKRKIEKKYANKSTKMGKLSQQKYLKMTPKLAMLKSKFIRNRKK